MRRPMRTFESPDGVRWAVEVRSPGARNALVVFRHPTGEPARLDRYAWYNASRPKRVDDRLDPTDVLGALTDAQLSQLFRRSMLISAADNPLNIPITHAG